MSDDLDERVAPPMDVLSKSRLARLKDMGAGTLVGEMAARITELEAENTTLLDLHSKAMKSLTSQVLKRRELEAEKSDFYMAYRIKCDAETKALEARIAELEALRTEHHQQYTENFAKLEAANDKMRKALEAIADHHHTALTLDEAIDAYHTERRDFAREGLK